MSGPKLGEKKLLEKPLMNGIAVPIAIVLIGALIIFGVTKMLSTDRGHKDLLVELNSKTFGNRWVAAFELSKYLAQNKIPRDELPEVISELSNIYFQTTDARTRNFIILALGSLDSPLTVKTLQAGLSDNDSQVKFNSVVSIGKMSSLGLEFNWEKLRDLVESEDAGLAQAVIYTLAKHNPIEAEKSILKGLTHSDVFVRYAAAIALIQYKNVQSIPTLEKLTKLETTSEAGQSLIDPVQLQSLKLNVLNAIKKNSWQELAKIAEYLAQNDADKKVALRATEVLNILKN